MAKLQDFISTVKVSGLMRTARYSVVFPSFAPMNTNNLVGMYCDQIQLPGYNMNTTASNTYGETREMPYGRLFDPISVSFYVDNEMEVKKYFDDWLFRIQSPLDRTFSYYNSYTADLQIDIEDLENKTKYSVVLYECYPKTMGAIQMDYASKDIMKLPVTLLYKYWKPIALANDLLSFDKIDSLAYINGRAAGIIPERQSAFTGVTANAITGIVENYGATALQNALISL